MVSPFEIISLVDIIIRLGNQICSFAAAVKDAPQEVLELCGELESLRAVVVDIGTSASELHETGLDLKLDGIFVCLKGCESEFNTIWLAVSSFQPERSLEWKHVLKKLSKSVSWASDSASTKKSIQRLERRKQSLVLAMLQSGLRNNKAIVDSLSVVHDRVEKTGEVTIQHLQRLQRTLFLKMSQVEGRIGKKFSHFSDLTAMQHADIEQRLLRLSDNIASKSSIWNLNEQRDAQPANIHLRGDVEFMARPYHDDMIAALLGTLEFTSIATKMPRELGWVNQENALQARTSMLGTESCSLSCGMSGNTSNNRTHALSKLSSMLTDKSMTRTIVPLMQNLDQKSAVSASLVWGSTYLLIMQAEQSSRLQESIQVALEQVVACLEKFKPMVALLPGSKRKELMMAVHTLYVKIVRLLSAIFQTLQGYPISRVFLASSRAMDLHGSINTVKSLSRHIIRDIEHPSPAELDDVRVQLHNVNRKQEEVLRALEEQRKAQESLQKEHRELAKDQRRILEMMEQLVARSPVATERILPATASVQVGNTPNFMNPASSIPVRVE